MEFATSSSPLDASPTLQQAPLISSETFRRSSPRPGHRDSACSSESAGHQPKSPTAQRELQRIRDGAADSGIGEAVWKIDGAPSATQPAGQAADTRADASRVTLRQLAQAEGGSSIKHGFGWHLHHGKEQEQASAAQASADFQARQKSCPHAPSPSLRGSQLPARTDPDSARDAAQLSVQPDSMRSAPEPAAALANEFGSSPSQSQPAAVSQRSQRHSRPLMMHQYNYSDEEMQEAPPQQPRTRPQHSAARQTALPEAAARADGQTTAAEPQQQRPVRPTAARSAAARPQLPQRPSAPAVDPHALLAVVEAEAAAMGTDPPSGRAKRQRKEPPAHAARGVDVAEQLAQASSPPQTLEGVGRLPVPGARLSWMGPRASGDAANLPAHLQSAGLDCAAALENVQRIPQGEAGPGEARKACPRCREVKPIGEFHRKYADDPTSTQTYCRKCHGDMKKEKGAVRAPLVDEKLCPNCGEVKRAALYYPNTIAPDGLSAKCRSCCKSLASEIRRQSMADHLAARSSGADAQAKEDDSTPMAASAAAAAAAGTPEGYAWVAGGAFGGGSVSPLPPGFSGGRGKLRRGHASDTAVRYGSIEDPEMPLPGPPAAAPLRRGAPSDGFPPGARAPRSGPRTRGGHAGGRSPSAGRPAGQGRAGGTPHQPSGAALSVGTLSAPSPPPAARGPSSAASAASASTQFTPSAGLPALAAPGIPPGILSIDNGALPASATLSAALGVEPGTALQLAAAEAVRTQAAAVIHAATDLAAQARMQAALAYARTGDVQQAMQWDAAQQLLPPPPLTPALISQWRVLLESHPAMAQVLAVLSPNMLTSVTIPAPAPPPAPVPSQLPPQPPPQHPPAAAPGGGGGVANPSSLHGFLGPFGNGGGAFRHTSR